jgi:hypothetical protein
MEPEGSLPHSQVSATCLYPEPTQSSPYLHNLIWEVPAEPRLCELYPGICLSTEEKPLKTSVTAIPHFPISVLYSYLCIMRTVCV